MQVSTVEVAIKFTCTRELLGADDPLLFATLHYSSLPHWQKAIQFTHDHAEGTSAVFTLTVPDTEGDGSW